MKYIYDKLEIPEPSADFESRIIAAANLQYKKHFFQRLAMVAACFILTLSILVPQQNKLVSQESILSDIEFFDEQYGFDADIS